MQDKGLIVALDTDNLERVKVLVAQLKNKVDYFKVGLELYTTFGPQVIEWLKSQGCSIFADLKYHDIPNTVSHAALALARQGVDIFDLHLSGGPSMVETTVNQVRQFTKEQEIKTPKILGITVLTSTSEQEYSNQGYSEALTDRVISLAKMGQACGLDGVVASPKEASMIRKACGPDFLIVTPGIRPKWAVSDDQQRITTPGQALDLGANYLVVGRPITKAEHPASAADKILLEMEGLDN